jgi:hypothetical protein
LSPVLGDSPTLVSAAIAADAAVHISGVGAVLEVVPAGSHQGRLQRGRPLLINSCEPPDLIGGQTEVMQCCPEWLASVDRIQEPLAYLGGQPYLRFRPLTSARIVTVRSPTNCARANLLPACCAAVRPPGSMPWNRSRRPGRH